MLILTITSELEQRFIPLIKLHSKLLFCSKTNVVCVFHLAADLLEAVQNYSNRVKELMKLFIISLHNWLEKMCKC